MAYTHARMVLVTFLAFRTAEASSPLVRESLSVTHDGQVRGEPKGKIAQLSRTSIIEKELIASEAQFTTGKIEADHGDCGGDRMSTSHGYAPIYAKYMTPMLEKGDAATVVAEIGILKGTGLAMWSKFFPESQIFGFDLNTSSYYGNVEKMRSVGFKDGRVKVTHMDQMQNNTNLLQSVFGDLRPHIVVEDGYHSPEAGEWTFFSMKPYLAQKFVYFIEDLTQADIEAGHWKPMEANVLKECENCQFSIDCPQDSVKNECVAVIHTLQETDLVAMQF